jgi:hypothetical protein
MFPSPETATFGKPAIASELILKIYQSPQIQLSGTI